MREQGNGPSGDDLGLAMSESVVVSALAHRLAKDGRDRCVEFDEDDRGRTLCPTRARACMGVRCA
jgi:hypothetical protein